MKRIKISSLVVGTLEIEKGKVMRGGWMYVDKLTDQLRWMSGLKLIKIETLDVAETPRARKQEPDKQKDEGGTK